jgi:glycosyltransferase involved in cell wall biosynthesis
MTNKHKILVLSSWASDEPLVATYLMPNVQIIQELFSLDSYQIFLQTDEKKNWTMDEKETIRRNFLNQGVIWIAHKHKSFGLRAFIGKFIQLIKLVLFVRKNNIEYLHPFAPGAGTMALFIHSFTKTKIVMDSWEPHADAMLETKTWRKNSLAYFVMRNAEKRLTFKSHFLLATSHAMKEYALKNFGITKVPILYRPAWVDFNKFDINKFDKEQVKTKLGLSGKFVCVCVSKLGGLYLKEDAFRFFKAGMEEMGKDFHVMLISANSKEEIDQLRKQFDIPQDQITHTQLRHDQIPEYLSASDVAFNPQCPVPSKRYGTPVKDGEYWAMGLPILLLPEISEDSEIVTRENVGLIIKDLTDESFYQVFQELKRRLLQQPFDSKHIIEVAKKYRSKSIAEEAYRAIYSENA